MAFKMNKFSGFKNADDNKRRLKEVKSSDEKVVLPTILDIDDSFEFLTETEINQLTNDEYKSYKEQIDNQFLLNPVDKDVHYSILEDDRHEKELEDEFYNSLSDDDAYDDY